MTTFEIIPQGPFSLREAAMFGFGQRLEPEWDGVIRLAFCVDGGYQHQVGIEVRQDEGAAGTVRCKVDGDGDPDRVRGQVARVLSLDHDGNAFVRISDRDPVIARLLEAAPGLRPPLFYSPYEAAAWAVLSTRWSARQAGAVRRRLSEQFGAVFELADKGVAALPTPEQLLAVGSFPGIPEVKMARLHSVARSALSGDLDAASLRAMDPADAMAHLRTIDGIGPFYSALIVIRATGVTDVLPSQEPKAVDLVRQLYGLASIPTEAELERLAEPWRPFRTWATVLIRAAANRVLATVDAAIG
jgi:DNA-3-methyladenine glycosylase II